MGKTWLLTHPQWSVFGQLRDAVFGRDAVTLELRVLLSLQLGHAPQISLQLLEWCLAFSKDSPLVKDLSWVLLPFLCKKPVGQCTATSLHSADGD